MSEIKGNTYKLAGFDIYQKGTLVNIFAKFCGVNEDPANLPQTRIGKLFANSEPMETPVLYPSLSAEQIVDTLVGPKDLAERRDSFHFGPTPAELLQDLGEDQFAKVLVEMGNAKKAFLSGEGTSTFVPVVK